MVEKLNQLSRADMIKFIVDTIKPRTANRLVMYYTGKTHQDAEPLIIGKAIESIEDLQKNAY